MIVFVLRELSKFLFNTVLERLSGTRVEGGIYVGPEGVKSCVGNAKRERCACVYWSMRVELHTCVSAYKQGRTREGATALATTGGGSILLQ